MDGDGKSLVRAKNMNLVCSMNLVVRARNGDDGLQMQGKLCIEKNINIDNICPISLF